MSSSSASGSSTLTQQMLILFYKLDREIFSRLVINLVRNPAEAMIIMALWYWLQEKGYPSLLSRLAILSDRLLNGLAEEAVICLKLLDPQNSPSAISRLVPTGQIRLTSRLMDKEVPLKMFSENRYTIISGVKNFLTNVCGRIFTDVVHMVMFPNIVIDPHQALVVPGSPHPLFGIVTVIDPRFSKEHGLPTGGLWGWSPEIVLSVDDRTMFLTFSRGFPVTVEEVKELFADLIGIHNCVESVQMENVPANEQPLYAKMVLISVKYVDLILKGNRVSKFRINGKHIWARKYERRE